MELSYLLKQKTPFRDEVSDRLHATYIVLEKFLTVINICYHPVKDLALSIINYDSPAVTQQML